MKCINIIIISANKPTTMRPVAMKIPYPGISIKIHTYIYPQASYITQDKSIM